MVKLSDQNGFTYPVLIGALLSIGLLGQTVVTSQVKQSKRALDLRVEAVGNEFLRALEKYHLAGVEEPSLPTSIAQLLDDTRNGRQRHLRQEPSAIFENSSWQLMFNTQGEISGIYLDSPRKPARRIIQTNDGEEQEIEQYSDWKFEIYLGE